MRLIRPDGTLQPDPVVDITTKVDAYVERGMLGIEVDRDQVGHPYLYLLYTRETDQENPWLPKTSRLSRFDLEDAGTSADPASEKVLVDGIPAEANSHTIGTVRQAPDGTLFAGSGDGRDPSQALGDPVMPYRPYDTASFSGKILHVDREGNGVPGRPFCPSAAAAAKPCAKVFATGFRNPFRFTVGTDAGTLWVGDVGWSWWELNHVTQGGNDGWPCMEGDEPQIHFAPKPRCKHEYATTTFRSPAYRYEGAALTHRGSAVMGRPTYTGGEYPDEFDGRLFWGDSARGVIRTAKPEPGGKIEGVDPFASGLALPTDLVQVPRWRRALAVDRRGDRQPDPLRARRQDADRGLRGLAPGRRRALEAEVRRGMELRPRRQPADVRLRLRRRDRRDGSDLRPRTTQVTLRSEPSGAPLTYGSQQRPAPATLTTAVGFDAPVVASARFVRDGVAYRFDRWDRSPTRSFVFRVPSGGATLTARFRPERPAVVGRDPSSDLGDRTPRRALRAPVMREAGLAAGAFGPASSRLTPLVD